jgi:T-complex protein 1 subunit eta
MFVEGVAFKKTFSYAGFEQQPKSFANPKVLLLNIELELKAEKENAEIRVNDPSKFQTFVDAEWNIIYNKVRVVLFIFLNFRCAFFFLNYFRGNKT